MRALAGSIAQDMTNGMLYDYNPLDNSCGVDCHQHGTT
jgi:hypothetical protein